MNNWLHSAHVSKQQPRQEPKYSNTSTDVEKTMAASARSRASRKHLHGRGEDCTLLAPKYDCAETPPRTWRRLPTRLIQCDRLRNTSTDVEKTRAGRDVLVEDQKHLHGRGEDYRRIPPRMGVAETPPRTWRRLTEELVGFSPDRNTSTDVEKTGQDVSQSVLPEKHLHGRGEDVTAYSLV